MTENTVKPAYAASVLVGDKAAKNLTSEKVIGKLELLRYSKEDRGPSVLKEGESHDFYDVWCDISGQKTGTGTYGDYNIWLGIFRAVNLATGETSTSTSYIPPAIADEMIEAGYAALNRIGVNASTGSFQIALRIGIEYDPKGNKRGYKWTAKPIVIGHAHDPIADMMQRAQALLPAPEQEPQEEPAKGGKK